jgi:hypothetical protein
MPAKEVASPPTTRMLNRWCRKIGLRDEQWLILRGWDLDRDETPFDNRSRIRSELGRWCRDPLHRSAVLDMYRAAYRDDAAGILLTHGLHWLEQRVAAAFQSEILVVVVRRVWEVAYGLPPISTEIPAANSNRRNSRDRNDNQGPPDAPKKTWVEVQLLDLDGAPVPNERYRVTLPDGSIKEGQLDDDGWMRESNIDPGTCTIAFPDIHSEEWNPK